MKKTTNRRVGGEITFPFRAQWIAAGLSAGLSLAEIQSLPFALLLQIIGAAAQANGAKLQWATVLPSEAEALRKTLDRLKDHQWPPPDLESKLGSTVPPPSEGWPILDEAPTD